MLVKIKTIMDVVREFIEENTPASAGRCHCGGALVKKVNGLYMGRFYYDDPKCRVCGRVYRADTSCTATEGEKDFMKKINTPMNM